MARLQSRNMVVVAIFVAAMVIATVFYFVSGSGGQQSGGAMAQGGGRPPPVVLVGDVEVGTVRRQLSAVGTLRSNESVVIQPEIAGRVAGIFFDEGMAVDKGARLIALDDAIFRAELQQAKARLALRRANHDRAKDLFKRGAASARNLDEALAEMRVAEADVALAQARLDKGTISAPFDGILGLRSVSLGDYVNPGQRIVNIEDIDPIKVDFRVPENYAGLVGLDQKIAIDVDALPGRQFVGRVYAIDPLIDPSGRAVTLRATVANESSELRPGMFARVKLTVAEHDDALLVPETAIFARGQDQFVYRVVDGKAVMAEVRTGIRRDGKVEIVEGISKTDRIVFEGHIKLQDGSPLKAIEAEKPVS